MDDFSDRGIEAVGHLLHRGLAVAFRLQLQAGLLLFHRLNAQRVLLEDLDRARHGAHFIAAAERRDRDIEVAAGKALHHISHFRDRANDAESHAENAGTDEEKYRGRDAPQQQGERADAFSRRDFRRRVLVVGLLDDVVDDGAVRRIARGDFSVGFRGRSVVGLGERGQQAVLDRGPEAAHLAVGFLHQLGLEHRVEIGLDPEIVPLVIFLLELNNPVAMRRKLRRIVQHEGCLEIGLDDVFRRRQDVGDKVVAELDLVVERTADLEL